MVEAFRIKISTETGIWEGPITCCTISGLIPKLVILNALTFLTSFPAWFWYTATSQCTHFSLSSPEPTWSPSLLPHPPCPPSPTHNFFTWKHVSQKSAAFFSLFIFKIMLPSLLLQKYDVILKQIWDLCMMFGQCFLCHSAMSTLGTDLNQQIMFLRCTSSRKQLFSLTYWLCFLSRMKSENSYYLNLNTG